MLPIRKDVLTFVEVSELWSREIGGIRAAFDIRAELVRAFWRGQLSVLYDGSTKHIDRVGLLRAINLTREHPGFLFVESSDVKPPTVTKLWGGSVSIDVQRVIVLPANQAEWTEDVLTAAYYSLAERPIEDFAPAIIPILAAIATTKDALAEFCDEMDYPRPRFWFGSGRNHKWSVRREQEVERWLRQLAADPKRKTKKAYFLDAEARFPGIPWKAFGRCWSRIVPESWRRSGPVVRYRGR